MKWKARKPAPRQPLEALVGDAEGAARQAAEALTALAQLADRIETASASGDVFALERATRDLPALVKGGHAAMEKARVLALRGVGAADQLHARTNKLAASVQGLLPIAQGLDGRLAALAATIRAGR